MESSNAGAGAIVADDSYRVSVGEGFIFRGAGKGQANWATGMKGQGHKCCAVTGTRLIFLQPLSREGRVKHVLRGPRTLPQVLTLPQVQPVQPEWLSSLTPSRRRFLGGFWATQPTSPSPSQDRRDLESVRGEAPNPRDFLNPGKARPQVAGAGCQDSAGRAPGERAGLTPLAR
ncbi:hypothetical protein NDU88_008395 [Pleurodeles waltl]|uniref:Uncharacterized protein n=1 Tax=Pleurodeles waltl TaxID=8319 RepID=A0AAV7PT15_PLEWA|nr:hypothetical protein NDU88_008395 [Pleurodeles waltl]